ncbi:MAG TPA: PEP-CTERM sorting domain-containing protein [Rhizomicrobium sp.]
MAARRSSAWRRKLLIGLALLAISCVAVAEYARSDIADPGKRGIIAALKGQVLAALKDPLALLDKRSPGRRSPGALHLTKSGTRPHERVLADVRQREPDSDLAPSGGPVAFVDISPAAAAPPIAPPGDISGTGDNGYLMPGIIGAPLGFPVYGTAFPAGPAVFGTPSGNGSNPGSPNSPPGNTGSQPPGTGDSPNSPNSPPGDTGGQPPGTSDSPDSPNSPPGDTGGQPPGTGDSPDSPNSPPGDTGSPPGSGPPTTIQIPEPATWLLMILGLTVLLAMRRTKIRRTD